MLRRILIVLPLFAICLHTQADELENYIGNIEPILKANCYECHKTGKAKGGVNLERFKSADEIIQKGQLWLKVIHQIKSRQMPPDTKPQLSEDEFNTLVEGLDKILQSALKSKNPNRVVVRRLSHSEYQYTIEDLLGVSFEAAKHFPSDGSGGGGFDNQARALFMTPLKLERYYEAAETIVGRLQSDNQLWQKIVPFEYKLTWWQKFVNWVKSIFSDDYTSVNPPEKAATKIIVPIASKAYRRFLKKEEEEKLTNLFLSIYNHNAEVANPDRFNNSLAQSLKAILISPNFLYRVEEENEIDQPYLLSDFELASRLSYFLWSSVPDIELLELANQEKLQDSVVLAAQVKRMLSDPKSKRFANNFSSQWFGINKLVENKPLADPEKFPEFTPAIRKAMYDEATTYFYHILTESKNFLELIDSDYTFLNEELANFYGFQGSSGTDMQKTMLADRNRGGILGMGAILTASSLPTRTSPVLRGKWILEQILGTPPPPPPPEAGELTEDEGSHKDVGLRRLLEIHRSKPGCQSCHQKMDPLGLGLENFDAIGRWRDSYGQVEIDPSGVMATGETFNNPAELRAMLSNKKELFARNLTEKMMSYALGRSVLFSDESAIRQLEEGLLENNFNTEKFLITLVNTYPFRYKINDSRPKSNEI